MYAECAPCARARKAPNCMTMSRATPRYSHKDRLNPTSAHEGDSSAINHAELLAAECRNRSWRSIRGLPPNRPTTRAREGPVFESHRARKASSRMHHAAKQPWKTNLLK